MGDPVLLAVRVPEETKRLVKEIAARKGTTVQKLVGELVDELIEQEARARPSLAKIINKLRDKKGNLEKLGVAHIDLFGSVVRNEAGKDSDIDVAIEFKQRKGMSLSRFASLQKEFESILKAKVDLSERQRLKQNVQRALKRDAIRVF
ncbi:MAG: nucleotidyltransferase domain-containing protein [Rhodospirillales bacterium]|nr:nucleotidyltransferase domain-containing protein [Rhodospirillales bacterium]